MAGKIKRLFRSDGVATSAPTSLIVTSSQVDFTLNNNATDTTISGLSFSDTTDRSGSFIIDVERTDDSNYYKEIFDVRVYWDDDASDWVMTTNSTGDTSGASFDITAAGAITYSSTNMAGGNYSGSGSISNIIKVTV